MLDVSAWGGAGRGIRQGAPYRRGTLAQGTSRQSPFWRTGSVIQTWICIIAAAYDAWLTMAATVKRTSPAPAIAMKPGGIPASPIESMGARDRGGRDLKEFAGKGPCGTLTLT
jgi:hypothetical protein